MDGDNFNADLQNNTVSGAYRLSEHTGNTLMDRDFEGISFSDCTLIGGDFMSSSFINCRFSNTQFKKCSLIGSSFIGCQFDNLAFSDCETAFAVNDQI